MRPLLTLPIILALAACDSRESAVSAAEMASEETVQPAPAPVPQRDIKRSVVRINSTQQSWNAGQPWEKNPPGRRRALAAIVGPQQVLTTAELVADATYIELESPDGEHFAQAKVIAVDYEANLALLGPSSETEGAAMF